MTAEIITFPVAKRPPAEMPQSVRERRHDLFRTADYWRAQGMGPEDVPADIKDSTRRVFQALLMIGRRDSEDDPKLEGA